ncbi:MAG: FecR domain-containing protein [Ekhidna sp.]|uniref:FecR family protein n=1 Tax=Ekhidna sp. TaxID=2608089 RepID=UPI0032EDBD4D
MKENTNHSELIHLASQRFAGEASPEELARLEELLADKGNSQFFSELEKVWNGTGKVAGITQDDINEEWLRLRGEMRLAKRPSFPFLKIAASIALIAVIGIAFYFTNRADQEYLIAGQVQTQTLNDGSMVTLNAQSELNYPATFSGETREVQLKGEAFFEVERNPEKPFIIRTSSVAVAVLGTSFTVRARESEKTATVVVASGSVEVSHRGDKIRLEVGEKGILDKESGRLFKLVNNDPNFLSWKTGKFTFANTPLSEVINVLDNAFTEKITLKEPSPTGCPVTVSFENQSLDSILEILKATLGLSIQKTKTEILISGQGC